MLSGCAHYASLPLDQNSMLAPSVAALTGEAASQPLEVAQVTELALRYNPDLRATRARRAIARAQLDQAGILVNPSFGGAILPLISGAGDATAWSVSLTQDLKSLVTYRARRSAADSSARQVYADILWQEWQVAGQARQITVDLIEGERSRLLLIEFYQLLARRVAVAQQAIEARSVTMTAVAPTLAALESTRTSLQTLDQRQLSLRHQLNALLGLAPNAEVPLATAVELPAFEPAAVRRDLSVLGDRRPDLLALRLAYDAQDANVRIAILSQFPDLIVGVQSNSDNSRVVNAGPSVTVGLPIFDRNQGNVAIANATREQLHADYSARLATAVGQVDAMLTEMEQLQRQLEQLRRELPDVRLMAGEAEQAFEAGNLDERSYLDLVTNRYTKEQDIMTLELALLDRQVALQTLIGAGLPSVETLSTSSTVGQ